MRVWDLSPGYLNRGSLLGEHRELHGLRSILLNNKKGYSKHPESVRRVNCLSGLDRRHDQLVAEMRIRGYVDRTPVEQHKEVQWPECFVTEPFEQISLLKSKYINKPSGRIPLPKSVQELWAQHKYSVMARDYNEYRSIGKRVAATKSSTSLSSLAKDLVLLIRQEPPYGQMINSIEHMWGYVSSYASLEERQASKQGALELYNTISTIAFRVEEQYLLHSTALSELHVYI